ncbi:hypothetical protein INT47_000699 [Mucor saturninus]|uniref:Uncharacterized protein n=1 Tax=Mucor saturninus TaxID=64648 RepID=A0A8H7VBJ7_9FUNG|nr:hypothetical protein INT47_000699 [Mucor saturninus]
MRYKKQQRSQFNQGTGSTNKPPIWRIAGRKRPRGDFTEDNPSQLNKKITHDQEAKNLMEALRQEMRIRLSRKILVCLEAKADVDTLKNECLSKFVADNFDSILADTKHTFKGKEKETKVVESPVIPIVNVPDVSLLPKKNENHTRVCTISFNSIKRKDIDTDIQQHIVDIIKQTMEEVSDYTTRYGIQLSKLFLLMNDHTFAISNNTDISLVKSEGAELSSILPPKFKPEITINRVAPPLSRNCLDSDFFNKEYRNLFNMSHLQLINSTYFGQRGTLTSTLNRKPIHKAFVNILGRHEENVPHLNVYVMKIALSSFPTNFMNMWSSKNRFNKLFTNLLKILLTVHLAPQRDAKLKKYKKDKQKQKDKNKSRV